MDFDLLLERLAAPARRALAAAGISTMRGLASRREAELAALHGIGPNALGTIKATLAEAGLSLKA